MRINTRNPIIKTHEGASAKVINPLQQLRRLVLSCLLWEDQFYVDGKTIAEAIGEAALQVSPETLLDLAAEARSTFNLRHVPLLLTVIALRRGAKGPGIAERIARIIQRPDEMGELLALYWSGGRRPLSGQLKKGLAIAMESFPAYGLAKYANYGDIVRMRDVMFLTHPNPNKRHQGRKEGTHELTRPELFKAIAAKSVGAAEAETWEAQLSAGGDKKEVFESLLREGKLGYLALLRNLRNMDQAGVDSALIDEAILKRVGAQRVLPFRFVAALRAAPSHVQALQRSLTESLKEIKQFTGLTIILVDVSGSMSAPLSSKSDMNRMDAAASLAAMFPGKARIFTFSDTMVEVPHYGGLAGIDPIINSQGHSSTRLGEAISKANQLPHSRLIVISDEQSHDRVPDPLVDLAYMVNVASYKHGVGYGRWIHIDGFSESIFRFIESFEAPQTDTLPPGL